MRLWFTLPDGGFSGALYPNRVATAFAAQLPLQLTFSDYNHVEKVASLPGALRVDGVQASARPEPGEIGYYAPANGIVLYYRRVGRWPGIVRIGRFHLDLDQLRGLPDGTAIRIERDDPEA